MTPAELRAAMNEIPLSAADISRMLGARSEVLARATNGTDALPKRHGFRLLQLVSAARSGPSYKAMLVAEDGCVHGIVYCVGELRVPMMWWTTDEDKLREVRL
jgi:hypothetical protein